MRRRKRLSNRIRCIPSRTATTLAAIRDDAWNAAHVYLYLRSRLSESALTLAANTELGNDV